MGNKRVPEVRFEGFNGDWEERKLNEVAEIIGGGTPSTAVQEYWDGDIDWYSPVEIGKEIYAVGSQRKITSLGLKKSSAKVLPANKTILFTSRAGIGDMAILKKDGATNQGFQSLVVNNNYNTYFVYSIGHKIKEFALKHASGSTFLEISGRQLGKMVLFVPSLEEQTKIGIFFKQLDDTIALHQQELTTLKQTKQGFLQKMFPKEGESVPEVRFPGFTGEWEERKLKEVATFINGRAYKQHELLNSGKYKVLRVGNFYTNDSWYYSDLELDEKYYAEKGDLLYTWSATFGPHIWYGDKVIYHYHIWKVDLSNNLDKQFAIQLLEYDKAKILSDKNGSTMVHITKKGMEEKKVLLTSIEEQTQIGNFFKQLDDTIALHQRELDALKETKKAFLQKMFV
ncbi:restriction endonuclease subunit S [Bacillus sp. FSL R5-0523]|uniref:restriction endonuclease subunit S n=1 Tax=Bacillus sp. FSL R5-0523 TaxID=2975304 RepID=UPI0030D9F4D2